MKVNEPVSRQVDTLTPIANNSIKTQFCWKNLNVDSKGNSPHLLIFSRVQTHDCNEGMKKNFSPQLVERVEGITNADGSLKNLVRPHHSEQSDKIPGLQFIETPPQLGFLISNKCLTLVATVGIKSL